MHVQKPEPFFCFKQCQNSSKALCGFTRGIQAKASKVLQMAIPKTMVERFSTSQMQLK
jgi:hypothetical protein